MRTSPIISSTGFEENLSSYQIANILDHLLLLAIQPLAEHTNTIQHWLAEMLPLIVSDGRRKVSKLEQEELIPMMFAAIMTTDPARQLDLVQQMKLERNQLFFLVTKVQEISESYLDDMLVVARTKSKTKKALHLEKLQAVEEELGTTRTHWHQALLTVKYWAELAWEFKYIVAEKYYKFAYKAAVQAEYATGLNISVADLYNNYILAIYRAIDKFDTSHGMLSTYIQMWFKNASSNPDFGHEVNIAFTIPASQRRIFQRQNWTNRKGTAIMNFANPIDDQVLEEQEAIPESSELADQLGQLGQKLQLGTFMLLNNIPYQLSDDECKVIERITQFEQHVSIQIRD